MSILVVAQTWTVGNSETRVRHSRWDKHERAPRERKIPFSAIDRLGSLQGLQAPTTCWNRARWKFGG